MPKILIIEDKIVIANYIKDVLLDNNYKNVSLAYNTSQALQLVKTFKPDLVLLDINLNEKLTGIDFSNKYLKNKDVIYITGQTELITLNEALETKPLAYLTKPLKEIDLLAAIKLSQNSLAESRIILKEGHDEVLLQKDKIIYVQSDLNYLDVFTKTEKITIRSSIDQFLNYLNEDYFIKVHRSFLVNKNHISRINSTYLEVNKIKIPISRGLKINF